MASPLTKFLSEIRSGKQDTGRTKASQDIEYERILDIFKQQFDKWWARIPQSSGPFVGFELIRVLGSGAFGQVVLAQHRITNAHYAVKIQSKAHLVKLKQVAHTYYESRILQAISYPLIIHLESSFKDVSYIYFVLPFINGGDMFAHLRNVKRFREEQCKFYGAQVVLALEYLHYLHLVYRDLKPENIMIDCTGYIKLTDLGFCKYVKTRTWTLCGTPDYLAPEIILSKGYGKSVDWWSFGVLVYEMVAGFPPFYDADQMATFEKITSLKYRYPNDFSVEIKDLIRNLLQIDLSRRYGILRRGVYDIKKHVFFSGLNWMDIYLQSTKPPFVPQVKHDGDSSYFDTTEEILIVQDNEDVQYDKLFKDF